MNCEISDIKEHFWLQIILSVYCISLYGRCLVWPDTHLKVQLSPSDSRDTIPLSREHP